MTAQISTQKASSGAMAGARERINRARRLLATTNSVRMMSFLLGLVLSLIVLKVSASELDVSRQTELEHLLKHDCGSCHGMTLKGGLGPALLAEQLRHKPRSYLLATIRDGHPGTPMPPWGALLSEADIAYLVELLLSSETAS